MSNQICVFYYGSFDDTTKARFIANPPDYLVVNTPGGSYKELITRPNETDIDDLQAVGIQVISYVNTGGMVNFKYAEDSPQSDRTYVRGCIDDVADEGCDGIFFDEGGIGTVKSPPDGTYTPCHAERYLTAPAIDCNGDANSWEGYTIEDYLSYCQGKGLLAILGTDYNEPQYLNQNVFAIADFILTDEVYPEKLGYGPDGSEVGYEDQCWVIGTGKATASSAASITNTAIATGYAAAYQCGSYGVLPDWYETYMSLLTNPPNQPDPPPDPPIPYTVSSSFINTMKDIVLEVNQRKIYNDIRSEIEESGTEELTEMQTRTVYSSVWTWSSGVAYKNVGVSIQSGDGSIVVQSFVIEWRSKTTGNWYDTLSGVPMPTPQLYSQDETMLYFHVFSGYQTSAADGYRIRVTYAYQSTSRQSFSRKLMVRATDDTSIAKYGRRVLPLRWPLGQTEAQMQSLVNQYLAKYKDPIPLLNPLHIQGSTDELITQIFGLKISDRILVANTELGLNSGEFFINRIKASHAYSGLLECDFECELIGVYESSLRFTLDTSLLDGPDILG